ncbi:hypothetical protein CDL15_Pgr015955 [Punica granatum]|uniref:Uncharacterized protein n=1 Tax=Punica granatum TaxID=22663 RepID=A0A218XQJ3_PUNGR|nr:hypothetical protein CDL15_Pgr015955 [Punica granatum]
MVNKGQSQAPTTQSSIARVIMADKTLKDVKDEVPEALCLHLLAKLLSWYRTQYPSDRVQCPVVIVIVPSDRAP